MRTNPFEPPTKPMSESEKYQGYAWIKVKKHTFDPQKTDRQNYDDLNKHHIEETTFLIEKVREIARKLDAVQPTEKP